MVQHHATEIVTSWLLPILIVWYFEHSKLEPYKSRCRAYKGSNSTIGFRKTEENLSTEVNVNFRSPLQMTNQELKIFLDILSHIMAQIVWPILWTILYGPPTIFWTGDKSQSERDLVGQNDQEYFDLSPCSPPLYHSPNRWVPATPTTADEQEEEDSLVEMNFVFQNNKIKTANFSSQQLQRPQPIEKCKTGTLRTYNTI